MILSTTYFGPVQWYSKICRCAGHTVFIEACESFVKQTYRNRCYIATANGPQALTIPVTHAAASSTGGSTDDNIKRMEKKPDISSFLISDHGNWRHLHWQALQTAYGESAFFEYYADDFRPFYIDEGPDSPVHLQRLLDFNMAGMRLISRLLDLDVEFVPTSEYIPPAEGGDLRYDIRPKNAPLDADFTPRPYYQVYREKNGFLPNMSILDLLFNEGPEAVKWLISK
ncbi:MAG: WbqC family protein [Prevotella sp.]